MSTSVVVGVSELVTGEAGAVTALSFDRTSGSSVVIRADVVGRRGDSVVFWLVFAVGVFVISSADVCAVPVSAMDLLVVVSSIRISSSRDSAFSSGSLISPDRLTLIESVVMGEI